MGDVQGLHLVGVPGHLRAPGHIADGNAQEGIQGEDHQLEHGVDIAQDHQPSADFGEPALDEVHREGQKPQQHKVDGGKINAGHDGHAQVAACQNADQIADVHHGGAGAGKAQILAGGGLLLGGFDGKNAVDGGNDNGNADVAVQKNSIHMTSALPCADLQGLKQLYSVENENATFPLEKCGILGVISHYGSACAGKAWQGRLRWFPGTGDPGGCPFPSWPDRPCRS